MLMNLTRIAAIVLLLSLVALPCMAAVSPEEAAKLKTTLTPLGAERAGNKEGTIPAWTGQNLPVPAGLKEGDVAGDFFPNEKPLFSITAKNMDQYADKLTEGVKAWMKRFPDSYRLDVYPTHRTAVYPQYVYEATFKNATRAKLNADGNGFKDALNGIPFPIPKSGIEVLWNHETGFQGSSSHNMNRDFIVSPAGKPLLVSESLSDSEYPYYHKGMTEEKYQKDWDAAYNFSLVFFTAPASSVGEMIRDMEPTDYSISQRVIYEYLVGQRRVRRAPSLAYDSPNPMNSGYGNNDEATMFFGEPNLYNWKLIGKKELYIPYNDNRMENTKDSEVFSPHHVNPDKVRWELHRVWVVDMTLVPGKRHVIPHRVIYFDEDSWHAVASDSYDSQGKLWKIGIDYPVLDPRVPLLFFTTDTYYNMQTGGWLIEGQMSPDLVKRAWVSGTGVPVHPVGYFSPDAMAAKSTR
jgi:hypothetical protein